MAFVVISPWLPPTYSAEWFSFFVLDCLPGVRVLRVVTPHGVSDDLKAPLQRPLHQFSRCPLRVPLVPLGILALQRSLHQFLQALPEAWRCVDPAERRLEGKAGEGLRVLLQLQPEPPLELAGIQLAQGQTAVLQVQHGFGMAPREEGRIQGGADGNRCLGRGDVTIPIEVKAIKVTKLGLQKLRVQNPRLAKRGLQSRPLRCMDQMMAFSQ